MKTSTLSVILCFLAGIFVNAVSIDKRQSRGSLQQVTGWTPNPTNVGMYVYIPNNLASSPGLILAIHYCQGSAQAYYTGSPYAQLAEEYGFIVIYPNSPHSGSCWDVSSEATLTHNGGGDSNSIANMVGYAVSTWGVNSAKVYVTGSSSGAMMTNVLSATYPELFKAASVYSGVPAGCFVSSTNQVDAWNSTCALGDQIDTPAQWGNVVRAMYAGYSGARPKMLIWHGTADTTLYPQNYFETMKQWTNVFGYNYNAPESLQVNDPQSEYNTTTYGPNVVGVYAQGVGHTVPIHGTQDMEWFGFA
ncbi:acetylxylan esterase A [Heliocybe sulcata]|uniref:Carboxylic ester hydrolase n=1 Tax=Heliocybe sulcata TaxID=5364 RepID=A0A5C3N0Q6_9AGAM|nr:acetylxylan esterase A [Heliocybe sulcata]